MVCILLDYMLFKTLVKHGHPTGCITQHETYHVKFTTNNRNEFLATRPKTIKTVNATKFLGIKIDKNRSWQEHISSLQTKLEMCTTLFSLRRIKILKNKNTILMAYHALFESHIRLEIVAWDAAG